MYKIKKGLGDKKCYRNSPFNITIKDGILRNFKAALDDGIRKKESKKERKKERKKEKERKKISN